ncbi:TPA: hypothetical protein ACG05V_004288 [Bacillus pacificus]|uniref:hypothetical protein n=1 Tax=Bacillus cereus group TaxID=86661 RepID=UPI00027CCD9E|nr:hypothetical protein [Bacillus cereus group sp. BfR-BA-01408]AFQ10284.1 hypothetical protein BCK_11915 [Bacillus cereus FRI-35]HDR6270871.1 hypothetical protein [Bacillus cereus]HDR7738714.1 hypothetical protein [Bacillus pacificus]
MNNPTYPVKVYVHALIGLSLPALTVFGFTVPTFRGIFFLFAAILLSYYGITIRFIMAKLNSTPMIPFYRLLAFTLSLLFFSAFMVIISQQKTSFVYFLALKYMKELSYLTILYTVSIFLFFLFELIFHLYKHIKKPQRIKNKFELFGFGIHLFIALFTTLILPDIIFGIIYSFIFGFYDNKLFETSIWEFSYFSFLIHFALPINSESIQNYVKLLNEHTLARVIQVIHINTCKFLDLTFLAILIQNFLGFISMFNIENKNNKNS